jgi:hypothetical protein
VQFDKSQVLDLMRSQGQHDQASQAEGELPDKVDPERDAGLLEKFGLNPQMLMGLLGKGGAGGGLGGLAGGLGGMLGK